MNSYHVESIGNGKFAIFNQRREMVSGVYADRDRAESAAKHQPTCDAAVTESRNQTVRELGLYYDPTD